MKMYSTTWNKGPDMLDKEWYLIFYASYCRRGILVQSGEDSVVVPCPIGQYEVLALWAPVQEVKKCSA